MTLKINSLAPDFKAKTTIGDISFHEWLGDSWGVLFSHPKDFTPVCTTELGSLAKLKPEFEKRNVKVIGLSVDPVEDHESWSNDIEEVTKTLRSSFLTQGGKVDEFEVALSRKVGAKYAVAVNSATSALHLACLALGLKKDDWLWTSPTSFVASANCGLYCGANIDFVDIDPLNGLMSIDALKRKLKRRWN